MIIIEGADAVGKTTLAKRLAEKLGYEYRHMTKPPEGFDYFYGFTDAVKSGVVQDRFHLGQLVYGAKLGKHTHLGPEAFAQLISHLRPWVFTIVVVENEERLRRRLLASTREEMYNVDEILEANREYKKVAMRNVVSIESGIIDLCDFYVDLDVGNPQDDAWNLMDAYFDKLLAILTYSP